LKQWGEGVGERGEKGARHSLGSEIRFFDEGWGVNTDACSRMGRSKKKYKLPAPRRKKARVEGEKTVIDSTV